MSYELFNNYFPGENFKRLRKCAYIYRVIKLPGSVTCIKGFYSNYSFNFWRDGNKTGRFVTNGDFL